MEAKRRYEWMVAHSPDVLQRHDIGPAVFADQLSICKEMLALLPAKIDRIHFAGDTTLEFL